jgi:adenylate cyclase
MSELATQQPSSPEPAPDPSDPSAVAAASAIADRVEEALLGGPPRYNRAEAAEVLGLAPEWCKQIWLALGFASVDDDARVFTDQDLEAMRAFAGLVESGKIAPDEAVPHVRAIGQAMSKLTDWQVREIVTRIGEVAGTDEAARTDLAAEMTGELLPVVEQLQVYAWRRHLVAAIGRLLPASSGQLSTATVCVGFADIVGYTSTVRHTDIDELAKLLESFEENAAETIVTNHGRVVKSLGDEVLFVVDSASDAAEIGVRLAAWGRDSRDLPQLRVGIALGRVLTRLGDVYGPAVNVASRLTSLARPGTVLVDKELAEALSGQPAYRLHPRRPAAVRGYHHLRSWALRPA